MPFGTGRLCSCNNDFCMKTSLCDYNPLLNPYDSSSGIDKNLFEMKENYSNILDYNNDKINNNYIIIILILLIIVIIYLLSKKKYCL